MQKAVILAAGLGTRMQKQSESAHIEDRQAAVADTGVKAMIPIDRPFLDYVLTALADADYHDVCLIIGPKHTALREYYESLETERITIHFAVQQEALGTANAVSAAEAFAGDDPFLVINSDNHYPAEAMKQLRDLDTCGTVAFDREGLLEGNIPAERIARFGILVINENDTMDRIVEKPDPEWVETLPEPVCVSMNCWRFDKNIFTACKNIRPSVRGEYEVTDAVQYAIDNLGVSFGAILFSGPVLDLTSRDDIEAVTEKLAGAEVRL